MYLSYIPGRPFSPSIAWCCEGRNSGSFGVVQSQVAGLDGTGYFATVPTNGTWVTDWWFGTFSLVNLWLIIMVNNWNNNIISGWWFGTWLLFFHMLGIIVPTDSYFSEG